MSLNVEEINGLLIQAEELKERIQRQVEVANRGTGARQLQLAVTKTEEVIHRLRDAEKEILIEKYGKGQHPAIYRETILAEKPVAYYRMDETSGSIAYDSSGNGHHAHLQGKPDESTNTPS